MDLTPRQTRFIDEYLTDLNGTQAAIRAGYAHSGARQEGSRLLAHADIRTIVQKKQADTATKLEITREDVLRGFLAAIQDAVVQGNPQAQIAGWRQIALMLGMYEPESRKIEVPIDDARYLRHLQTLPEKKLLRLARGSGKESS